MAKDGGLLRRRFQRPKVLLMLALAASTSASSLGALTLSIIVRLRLAFLRSNSIGDPEKEFLDTCLRDFEGLSTSSSKYRTERAACVRRFLDEPKHRWLPVIRSPVDQHVCDQEDLCSGGDPGQCLDQGRVGDSDHVPGEVSACYSLMNDARHPSKTAEQSSALRNQFASECAKVGRWDHHERKVQLQYCMWKHMSVGVCTNTARTTCPNDHSCCPSPQNYTSEDGGNSTNRTTGPDVYSCQRSPVLGIFCQYVDYATIVQNSVKPCTAVTCPETFQWCADLADLSGQCLGAPCQDFHHTIGYITVFVGCASLGLLLDLIDGAVWFFHPKSALPKAASNALGMGVKLAGASILLSSGASSFVDDVVEKGCFNNKGTAMLEQEMISWIRLLYILAGVTAVGSCCLAPLSALWVGRLAEVPYAHVKEGA